MKSRTKFSYSCSLDKELLNSGLDVLDEYLDKVYATFNELSSMRPFRCSHSRRQHAMCLLQLAETLSEIKDNIHCYFSDFIANKSPKESN